LPVVTTSRGSTRRKSSTGAGFMQIGLAFRSWPIGPPDVPSPVRALGLPEGGTFEMQARDRLVPFVVATIPQPNGEHAEQQEERQLGDHGERRDDRTGSFLRSRELDKKVDWHRTSGNSRASAVAARSATPSSR
jgi:hypothetical protein